MNRHLLVIALCSVALVACKKDDKKKSDEGSDKPAPTESAKSTPAKPAAPTAKVPEGKPTWIEVPGLGVQIQMPEGTELEYDAKAKRAHLRLVPLKVNFSLVDEYTGSFEKWNEKSKSLIKMIKSEKTDNGWTVIKHVNSEIFKKPMYEGGVRIKVAGTELSCGASAETEELINAVVAACQSIKPL